MKYKSKDYSLVYITVPSRAEAQRIGKVLVERRLAACVNIFPIFSIYRWKNRLEKEKEYAMFVKTRSSLVSKLIGEVKQHHSYEVPCIISLSLDKGNPDFLNWIRTETETE